MKRKNIYIIFSIALIFIVTLVAFYSAYTFSVESVNNDEIFNGDISNDMEFEGELISNSLLNSEEYLSTVDSIEATSNNYISCNSNHDCMFAESKRPSYSSQVTGSCWAKSATNSLMISMMNHFDNLGYSSSSSKFKYIHMIHSVYNKFTGGNNEYGIHNYINKGGYDESVITYFANGLGPTQSFSVDDLTTQSRNTILNVTKNYRITEMIRTAGADNTNEDYVQQKVSEIKAYLQSGYGVTITSRSLRDGCRCFKKISSTSGSSYCPNYYKNYKNGNKSCNWHSTAIIGWNDEFDNYNVDTQTETNGGITYPADSIPKKGAWIVLSSNSFGDVGGQGEKVYISYYDVGSIFSNLVISGVTKLNKTNDPSNYYDNIYQYYPYLTPKNSGSSNSSTKVANVFTKGGLVNETLNSIGFYVTCRTAPTIDFYFTDDAGTIVAGAEQNIYTTTNYIGSKPIPAARGYYTFKLDNAKEIKRNRFIIALKSSKEKCIAQIDKNPPTINDYYVVINGTNQQFFGYNPSTLFNIASGKNYEYKNESGWKDLNSTNKSNYIKAFTTNTTTTSPSQTNVSSIEFKSDAPLEIQKGNSHSVNYTSYVKINPSGATIQALAWRSGNTDVLTVDANGKVVGQTNGTAKLYAYATDGSGQSANINITVRNQEPSVPVESINIDTSNGTTVNVGSDLQLSAHIYPNNATPVNISWSSDHTSIATVDSTGLVHGISKGTVTITLTVNETFTKTVQIKVIKPATSISLDENSISLYNNGSNRTLHATLSPSDSNDKKEWTSSNTSVATVDSGGKVTARSVGNATITVKAKYGNKTDTCQVVVNEWLPLQNVIINTPNGTTTNVGDHITLTISFDPLSPTNVNIFEDESITWSSSNTSVAAITSTYSHNSRATITGISEGSATITAIVRTTDGQQKTRSVVVNVSNTVQTTTYTVKHYQAKLDGNYPSNPTDIVTINLVDGAEIPTKTYTGFNTPNAVVANPNNRIVEYHYSRKLYTVSLQKDTGIASLSINGQNINSGIYKFGEQITINAKVKNGYTWKEWLSSSKHYSNNPYVFELGASNVTFKATTTENSTPEEVTINLIPNSITLEKGKSDTIKAEIKPKGNYVVTWKSEKESIAIVDKNGNVTAKSPGETKIIATINTPDGDKQASCRVTIKENEILPTGITLNKTETSILEGQNEILTARVIPEDATNKDVTWTTSDSSIATIVNGKVTGIQEGVATITAKTKNNKIATCKVNVKKQEIHVNGISINESGIQLGIGSTKQLTTTITPSEATNQNVIWSSSNTSVATVSSSGLVTAKSKGKTTITVTTVDGNKTANVEIEVKKNTIAVTKIEVSPIEVELNVGDTKQLITKITPTNATDKSVTYSSSDNSIATVNNSGLVTAKSSGEATITVTSNSSNEKATMKVKVNAGITIKLDKIKVSILKGKEYKINAIVTGSEEEVIWTSSNTNIATVNNGVIKAINKGKNIITAKLNSSNIEATCEVTVIAENEQKIEFAEAEYNLFIGDTLKPEIITTPTDMKIEKIEWLPEDIEIITVEENQIKGLKVGTTKLKLKVNDRYEDETTVIVKDKPLVIMIEDYNLGFDENTYHYELKIKNEKELKITANKEIEVTGNENLKNKSVIRIINLSNQKEYDITIIKKNNYTILFIIIIAIMLGIGTFVFIKKKKD